MKVSLLFIFSSICLAECYRLGSSAASSANELEYPRLDFASYVAIRDLLSRLLTNKNNNNNDNNVAVTGKIPNSVEAANTPAEFEVNSPVNTDTESQFVVAQPPNENSVGSVLDFPVEPPFLEKQTQGSQEGPLIPTDLEAVNTNNNQPLSPPLPTNQNRPRPPSSSISAAVQPVLPISNSQSVSYPAGESNSILAQSPQASQPPQAPQTPSSIESFPTPPQISSRPQEFPTPPQLSSNAENNSIPASNSNSNRPLPPISSLPSRPNSALPSLAYLLSTLNQNGSIPSAPHAPFLG
ncbi:PREDICTED: sporozoite surface protein 2-like [Rhagoletis zephyria]|uniref:sporozoite surface protein 2-like n=1 Tax=Rhagoletis zephyria TaxID=28612 RepID=UPI00081147DF|nr:PREDICTED: sporozoite surface protein 2-like [Rhagoletis zephyria]